jgi:hypothetical protein
LFKSGFLFAVGDDGCAVKTIPSSLFVIVDNAVELILLIGFSLLVTPGVDALENVDTGGQF